MRFIILALASLSIGCSTAGPFVTNISGAGPNKLLIEKCHVQFNSFVGYITKKIAAVTPFRRSSGWSPPNNPLKLTAEQRGPIDP